MMSRGRSFFSGLCGWGSGLFVCRGGLCRWLSACCGVSTVLRSGGCPDSPSSVYLLVRESATSTHFAASAAEEEFASGQLGRGVSAAVV